MQVDRNARERVYRRVHGNDFDALEMSGALGEEVQVGVSQINLLIQDGVEACRASRANISVILTKSPESAMIFFSHARQSVMVFDSHTRVGIPAAHILEWPVANAQNAVRYLMDLFT